MRASVLLLCFVLLSYTTLSHAEGCQATALIKERPGSWHERNVLKRIVDVQIVNTGSCSFSGSLLVDIHTPAGTTIGYSWGWAKGEIKIGEISPGQTVAGAGFVLSGLGTPTATVISINNCGCSSHEPTPPPSEPTSPPSEPTSPPSEPTAAPTLPPVQPTPPPTPGDGTYYQVGLKFLVLTCTMSDIRLGVAKSVIESVGSQYDVISYDTQGTAVLPLTYADGTGKYYAIVATTDLATCYSADQVIAVTTYCANFNVKRVVLYTFPYATHGVSSPGGVSLDPATSYLSFAPTLSSACSFLNPAVQIPSAAVFAYPSSIVDAAIATPAVYITINGVQSVVAAFVNTNGMKVLEFYVDQADWALFPIVVGHAWFEWASNGIFAGARRVEFNAHMDDIFMATGMFDPATGEEGEDEIYRITPQDLTDVSTWQTALNARLPAGSNFTLTFPFNGATVKEKGGYNSDALYLKAKQLRDQFIWESHTWTHPYLDNYTYEQVMEEWTLNDDTSHQLFGSGSLANIRNFCYNSVITPSITGLFNGEALRAMYDFGIRHVVGDNSRVELVPTDSLYHGIHTTEEVHGFNGMYIVPRQATNIYYDGSLPEHITEQYNYRYEATQGALTFDQIVDREVTAALNLLLRLRHDPYMFHQANLRFFDYEGKHASLLSFWTDAVVDALLKYISLPVISRKHDDLAEVWLAREARDACGFAGFLRVEHASNAVVSLVAQATGTCSFGISGVKSSSAKYETYGSEETIWVDLTPGASKEIVFDTKVYPL